MYRLPARSRTRPPEICLDVGDDPVAVLAAAASAVRIRKLVSCIARLLIRAIYAVELTNVKRRRRRVPDRHPCLRGMSSPRLNASATAAARSLTPSLA